jgi:hypothetical protein
MKYLFKLGLLAIILFCFTNSHSQQITKAKTKEGVTKVKGPGYKKDKSTSKESFPMQGAYSMYRQVLNDGNKDSLLSNEQMKIYTDRHMMYAQRRAEDSLANYGIGTYKVQNGKVMEYIFYTASGGPNKDTFELKINKTGDGYSQIINFPDDEGRNFVLTEDYKAVGKNVSSPLDGAWKQTRNIYISGNGDTITNDTPTQFKVFQSGYFIWANTSLDSTTQKPVSFFGYGTFEMNGNNQATEVNTQSSYATALVGMPVKLDLKFNGKDTYQQTIVFPDGPTSIEYYERLK